WLVTATVLCILIAGVATYRAAMDEANELFDLLLEKAPDSLLAYGAAAPSTASAPSDEDVEEAVVIQLYEGDGDAIYLSHPSVALPRYGLDGLRTVSAGGREWRVFGARRGGRYVQAAQMIVEREEIAAELALNSLLPFLFLCPLLAAVIAYSVRRSLDPLKR